VSLHPLLQFLAGVHREPTPGPGKPGLAARLSALSWDRAVVRSDWHASSASMERAMERAIPHTSRETLKGQ